MAGLTVENSEANTAEEITSYHQRMEPSGGLQEGSGERRVGALRRIFLHAQRCVFSKKGWLLSVFMLWFMKCISKQKTTLLEELGNGSTLTLLFCRMKTQRSTAFRQPWWTGWDSPPKPATKKWCTTPKFNMEAGKWWFSSSVKISFSQVGLFSGEPCTPDGRFNGERNLQPSLPLFLERNFMIIWNQIFQGSMMFLRQQILPTCTRTPTHHFSVYP